METADIALSDEDRRLLALWAAGCAARVVPLFEATAPGDGRPRAAVEGVRAFALGGPRTGELRALAWAAYAAGRDVDEPAATAAARAAGCAAAIPYVHALATPHQVRHVLGPALYGARARELAAGDPAAGDEEIRWAVEHASPAVREVVRRLPAGRHGRSRAAVLSLRLETALRR